MTSAPTAAASTSAASSYNFIEQMIQREAQAISASCLVAVGHRLGLLSETIFPGRQRAGKGSAAAS